MLISDRLWEGSWADDAITENKEADEYIDPSKIRTLKHTGKHFGQSLASRRGGS
jgi:hypothetical protein